MANRHLSRSVALQSLFEWDVRGQKKNTLKSIVSHNLTEFAPGMEDTEFINDLVLGTTKYQDEIDKLIQEAAPDWPLEQNGVLGTIYKQMGEPRKNE
ncbi:MAG: hypothetical protein HYR90_00530 [Candidatus Andersenbacteria bacterium]|nr:hypothetical protein [Candidatus Andersenbacteria bacterium]